MVPCRCRDKRPDEPASFSIFSPTAPSVGRKSQVHVVKKTTGRHYAMKIQHKAELLRSFARSLNRLDNEKVRFGPERHPAPVWTRLEVGSLGAFSPRQNREPNRGQHPGGIAGGFGKAPGDENGCRKA